MPEEILTSTTSGQGQDLAGSQQTNTQRYETLYGTASAAPAQTSATDVTSALQPLLDKIAALEERLSPPVQSTSTSDTDVDWLAMLAKGDKDKGEQALADKIDKLVGGRRVNEAMQLFRMNQEIDSYTNSIRAQNPELASMESYITNSVQAKLNAAQTSGKVKSPADYVTVYKDILTKEVSDARNLILTFRGEGAQNATTRTQQVTGQAPLRPNTIGQQGQQNQSQGEAPAETASDYLTKRQDLMQRQKNMAAA